MSSNMLGVFEKGSKNRITEPQTRSDVSHQVENESWTCTQKEMSSSPSKRHSVFQCTQKLDLEPLFPPVAGRQCQPSCMKANVPIAEGIQLSRGAGKYQYFNQNRFCVTHLRIMIPIFKLTKNKKTLLHGNYTGSKRTICQEYYNFDHPELPFPGRTLMS